MQTPDNELRNMSLASLRSMRDAKLSETDWTQLADAPITAEKKSQYLSYRQALRDLPQNITDPSSVAWPKKPD